MITHPRHLCPLILGSPPVTDWFSIFTPPKELKPLRYGARSPPTYVTDELLDIKMVGKGRSVAVLFNSVTMLHKVCHVVVLEDHAPTGPQLEPEIQLDILYEVDPFSGSLSSPPYSSQKLHTHAILADKTAHMRPASRVLVLQLPGQQLAVGLLFDR